MIFPVDMPERIRLKRPRKVFPLPDETAPPDFRPTYLPNIETAPQPEPNLAELQQAYRLKHGRPLTHGQVARFGFRDESERQIYKTWQREERERRREKEIRASRAIARIHQQIEFRRQQRAALRAQREAEIMEQRRKSMPPTEWDIMQHEKELTAMRQAPDPLEQIYKMAQIQKMTAPDVMSPLQQAQIMNLYSQIQERGQGPEQWSAPQIGEPGTALEGTPYQLSPEGEINILEKPLTYPQAIAKKRFQKIEELQSIPKEQRTSEQQAQLDKMIIGQPMVNIDVGKPASASERTAIADARASMDALDNLWSLFDESFVGPFTGRIAPAAGLFGKTTQQQEEFMAATSAFKNVIIKQITGAQMSEVEAKRIMKQIPDITDPTERWKAKWKQSMENIKRMHQRRIQILEQSGLKVPGTVQIQNGVQSMSDEELKRIAGLE